MWLRFENCRTRSFDMDKEDGVASHPTRNMGCHMPRMALVFLLLLFLLVLVPVVASAESENCENATSIFAKSACARAQEERQRQTREPTQERVLDFPIGSEPNTPAPATESSAGILREQQELERQRMQLEAQRLQLQREQLELQRQQLQLQQQQFLMQQRNNLMLLIPPPNFAMPLQPLQPYHPAAPVLPPASPPPPMRGQINCYTIGSQTTCY